MSSLLSFREIIIPLIFMSIFMGYEISVTFLIQYFRFRKNKSEVDNLIFSHSIFMGLLTTALLIFQINFYYIDNDILNELFERLYSILFTFSLSLYFFLLSKVKHEAYKSKTMIRMGILTFIPPILIILFGLHSIFFIFNFTLSSLGVFYIFKFRFDMIRISIGKLKIRLIPLFIGHLITGLSLLLFFFLIFNSELMHIILGFLLLAGLLTIFFSQYKSPIFLEYRWKANLIALYILNMRELLDIYHYEFKKSISSSQISNSINQETKIKREFIELIGIQRIASNGLSGQSKVNKIKEEGFYIYFNYGDPPFEDILYVLTTTSDMESHEYLLKIIKNKFQKTYKHVLNASDLIRGTEGKVFLNFSTIIENLLK